MIFGILAILVLVLCSERESVSEAQASCQVGCLVAQSCSPLSEPMDRNPPDSVLWDSLGKNNGVGCHASSRGSSNPGIEPRSPALQADCLVSEPPGKPKNTGVGSLSLLQGIFLTQESNCGLLHCRQILYQLSYQGNLTILDGDSVPSQVANWGTD